MKKVFTLIIALFAIVSASMAADAITSLKLTTRINGKAAETQEIPFSGFSLADITDESTTSLIIQKAEITTTGNVSDVLFFGSLHNSDSAPKSDSWMNFPLQSNGSGSWVLDMGEGVDLIEPGGEGKTKIFEFYIKAVDGSGSDIYYNNGGQNYQIKFTIGSGGSSDWTVKFYKDGTARLSLQWDDTSREYSYNGDGIREQYYGENPGEVSSFTINGFYTTFVYNKDAGVEISDVSLQYRINVDGTEGQWNRIDGVLTTENYDNERGEYKRSYKAENLNVNVLNGLTSGHNYVLEYVYQVVTTGGDYKTLRQGSSEMQLAFTVKEGSAIEGVSESVVNKNTPKYSVAGALVGDGYKGIVIQGGKKVMP